MLTPGRVERMLGELPALSHSFSHLMQLLEADEADYAELERWVEQEPALTGRVLRLANSAFFGFGAEIAGIADACLVLGTETLRELVLAVAVMERLAPRPGTPLSQEGLWRHALATAAAARAVAGLVHASPGAAATAGLLHDIGKLALNVFAPDHYRAVVDYQVENAVLIGQAEQAVLGISHADVGVRLAQRWHLPPYVLTAIARHDRPDAGPDSRLVDIVHLADILARGLDIGCAGDDLMPELAPGAWERLGLDWGELQAVLPRIAAMRRLDLLHL